MDPATQAGITDAIGVTHIGTSHMNLAQKIAYGLGYAGTFFTGAGEEVAVVRGLEELRVLEVESREVGIEAKVVKQIDAKITGAFSKNVNNVSNGFGKLTDRAVNITRKGLDIVENHLSKFGDYPENKLMLERLDKALNQGQVLTEADASFYVHELAEATKMSKGWGYTEAHQFALEKYKVSPFSVYHPEVIEQLNILEPGYFNDNWVKFAQENNEQLLGNGYRYNS